MANLFDDYPDRVAQIKKHAGLHELALPMEAALGEEGTYKDTEEAMELFLGTLSELGKYAGNEMLGTREAIDRKGAQFKDGQVTVCDELNQNLRFMAEMGVFAGPITRGAGGLNLPRGVMNMVLDVFGHACPNSALTLACYSMAFFMEEYGTEEQKAQYLDKMASHQMTTAMALTEPGAGSDLGKLRTTAEKKGDHWIINGTKQFITSGHADLHFTLARSKAGTEGLDGLSVFLIPKQVPGKDGDNFEVTNIEDKICLHASPTCSIAYENSVGQLFGPEGDGFKCMLYLMNEARLAMSTIANGIIAGSIDEAKKYARTRVTMGKPIIEHPMVADMIHEAEVELAAGRALVSEASLAFDWMKVSEKNGDTQAFKKWRKRYRRLTPLCKYFCSEKSVEHSRKMLQVFGGYGVCREYPAELFFREALIYPIYEGTSQIQSLMVLKDTLKDVASQAGGFLGSLTGAWAQSKVTRDPIQSKLLQARNELNQAIRTVLMSIIKDKFKSDIESLKEQKIQDFLKGFSLALFSDKTDLTFPFLWAERLTRVVCDYYALKSMIDRHDPADKEHEKTILEFAELALPRMRMENHYMINRLPSTLDWIEREKSSQA